MKLRSVKIVRKEPAFLQNSRYPFVALDFSEAAMAASILLKSTALHLPQPVVHADLAESCRNIIRAK